MQNGPIPRETKIESHENEVLEHKARKCLCSLLSLRDVVRKNRIGKGAKPPTPIQR